MRINIYAEEMTNETELVVKEVTNEKFGTRTFYGLRFYLHSPEQLHADPKDDDRSAITLWIPWTRKGGHDPQVIDDVLMYLRDRLMDATSHEGWEGDGLYGDPQPVTETRNAMLEAQATKYKITYDEAVARQNYWFKRVGTVEDNPSNPICIGCMKHPVDLPEYLELAAFGEDDYIRITGLPDDERRRIAVECVQQEEGTFNRENGHFLCNMCYIIEGMPTSERGWVAP